MVRVWCGFVVYRCHEGACGPHGCVRVGCACGCGSAETEAERDSQAKDNALCVWVWCEGPCVWAGCVCGVGGMGVCMCVWRAPVGAGAETEGYFSTLYTGTTTLIKSTAISSPFYDFI